MTPPAGYPIISPSGIPSAVRVFRIVPPNLISTLWDASLLARIAEPRMALSRWNVVSPLRRLLSPDATYPFRFPPRDRARM